MTGNSSINTACIAKTPIPRWIRAARDDRAGHLMHIGLLVFWGFSIGLGWPAWVKDAGLGALAVWAVLRIGFGGVRFAWDPWTRSPLMWLTLAWLVWPLITLFWSAQPSWGLDHWWGLRVLLAPLLIWPALHCWRSVETGFVIAVGFVGVVLILQATDWLYAVNPERPAAGMQTWLAGLLSATGALIAFLRAMNTRSPVASVGWIVLALVLVLALVFNATKSAQVAFVAGLAIGTIGAVYCGGTIRRRCYVLVAAIGILIGCGWAVDASFNQGRAVSAISYRYAALQSNLNRTNEEWAAIPVNHDSTTLRQAMWKAAATEWQSRPVLGWGYGGMAHALREYPGLIMHKHEVQRLQIHETPMDPHSTWLFMLTSSGLVGFALMMSTIALTFFYLARQVASTPAYLSSIAVGTCWVVTASFETNVLNGTALGVLAMVIVGGLAAAQQWQYTHATD